MKNTALWECWNGNNHSCVVLCEKYIYGVKQSLIMFSDFNDVNPIIEWVSSSQIHKF